MQRLLHFPPATPLRLCGYVPVLQDKRGELDALRYLAATRAEVVDALTPVVRIVGPKRGHLTRDALKGRVRRIQGAVGSRPMYLDFVRADPVHAVELRGQPLTLAEAAYHYARLYELAAIPVVGTDGPAALLEAAGDAAAADSRGVAIRHAMLGVTSPSGASTTTLVSRALEGCGIPADEVDLWLDLGYIGEDVEVSATRIARLIGRLERLGPWRRIMLTGSSMPSALSCVPEGTDRLLPRREWELWQQLPAESRARLDFGDYAIQHPSPPADGGASMRANIRYTLDDGHFIVRGRGPLRVEGYEQYVGLCARLTTSRHFAGGDYSWGDEVIESCAEQEVDPGAQNMWRAVGTAHHLRVVTEQLRTSR